jgi:hypothetical protein
MESTEELNEKDSEMCAIALDEAFNLCGNNDVIFEQIAILMGIRNDVLASLKPLKDKYQKVLADGVGTDERSASRWVLARAWDLTINEGNGIMAAFGQAWTEADIRTGKSSEDETPGADPIAAAADINEFPVGP